MENENDNENDNENENENWSFRALRVGGFCLFDSLLLLFFFLSHVVSLSSNPFSLLLVSLSVNPF